MRVRMLVALFALLVGSAPLLAASESQIELRGEYSWTDGRTSGPVTATFQGTGADTWEVVFSFRFDGQSHRYAGTATGSLDSGRLEGRVQTENGRRTFQFRGAVRERHFEGEHSEVTRRGELPTGTLELMPR